MGQSNILQSARAAYVAFSSVFHLQVFMSTASPTVVSQILCCSYSFCIFCCLPSYQPVSTDMVVLVPHSGRENHAHPPKIWMFFCSLWNCSIHTCAVRWAHPHGWTANGILKRPSKTWNLPTVAELWWVPHVLQHLELIHWAPAASDSAEFSMHRTSTLQVL